MATSQQLAELEVSIRADVDAYKKDMRETLDITKKASQGIMATINKIKSGATLGILGAGGVKALTFIKESIALAREQAKQEKVLEAQLKATAGAVGLTADEIKAFASARQEVTNFGDEATLAAANILTSFTAIKGDQFKGAIVAVQDLSVLMNTDMKSAAIAMGKALNDPIKGLTALTRSGVSFNDQQRERIALLQQSGDIMGAQNVMLEAIAMNTQGTAEAVVNPVIQFQNAWGDFQETMGDVLIPMVNEFFKGMKRALAEISPGSDDTRELGEELAYVGKLAGELVVKLVQATKALHEMSQVAGGLANAVAPGFLTLGGLSDIFAKDAVEKEEERRKETEKTAEAAKKIRQETQETTKAITSAVSGGLLKGVNSLGAWASGVGGALQGGSTSTSRDLTFRNMGQGQIDALMKLEAENKSVMDLVKARQEEIRTMGMTERQLEMEAVLRSNASRETVMQYIKMQRLLDVQEKEKEEAKKQRDALVEQEKAYKSLRISMQGTIQSMKQEVQLFGLSGRERQIAMAKMQGATEGEIKAMKKYHKELSKLEILNELKSPVEQFTEELQKLEEVRAELGEEKFLEAVQKLKQEFEDPVTLDFGVTGLEAINANSAEATQFIANYRKSLSKGGQGNAAALEEASTKAINKTTKPTIKEMRDDENFQAQLTHNQQMIAELRKQSLYLEGIHDEPTANLAQP